MYSLTQTSLKELKGVHADLTKVVERAIELSVVNFVVADGVRTLDEQKEYVRTGASHTLQSLHLPQGDGFGHAVDLVPFINGKARWEWPPIYHIAAAVHQAATELNVRIIWGGVWDRELLQLGSTAEDLKDEVEAYVSRRRAANKRAFLDGPHYQIKQ